MKGEKWVVFVRAARERAREFYLQADHHCHWQCLCLFSIRFLFISLRFGQSVRRHEHALLEMRGVDSWLALTQA